MYKDETIRNGVLHVNLSLSKIPEDIHCGKLECEVIKFSNETDRLEKM